MTPLNMSMLGTVEFFVLPGDTVKDVKVRITSDIPSNANKEIAEHIANVQFGVFYSFLNDEDSLADIGRIFRAGMVFAQRNMRPNPPPDDRGCKDPEPKPLPTDGEGIDKMVKDLIDRED